MPTVLCRSLDSPPDRSNWGLTNQRREELFRHTNTHLSLVSSKLNVCDHCLATYKARYTRVALQPGVQPNQIVPRHFKYGGAIPNA